MKHWTDNFIMQNETEDDFELVEEKCEWCDGTGECPLDEYSKEGQLVGVGTLTKKCICKMNNDDDI